jgi:hypothetical protein
VNNLEQAFPANDWVAVIAQGSSRQQAGNAAMSALARAFNSWLNSLLD